MEDDEALNRMICQTLKLAGYEVHCETDPIQSLNKVVYKPSLLVLDLNLSNLDGSTFLTEAIERGFVGRVIVISAAEDAAAISHWMGADAFLPKPFDPDQLIAALERLAQRSF